MARILRHYFQLPHEVVNVSFARLQLEKRISHQLSRTVKGYVASTIHLVTTNSFCSQFFVGNQKVVPFTVPTEGDGGRVLQEKQHIGLKTPLLGFANTQLQIEDTRVFCRTKKY